MRTDTLRFCSITDASLIYILQGLQKDKNQSQSSQNNKTVNKQTVITFSWDCDLKITRPLRWISTWLFRSFLGELMSTSYFGIVTSSKPYSRHLVAMWCAKSLLRFEPARCGSLEKYLWRTNKSSRSVFDNGSWSLARKSQFLKRITWFPHLNVSSKFSALNESKSCSR